MKRFLLFFIFVASGPFAYAQFYPATDLYNYDPKLINPAYAGLKNEQNYQAQYSSVDQNASDFPYTAMVAFSSSLRKINSGVGVFLSKNREGPITMISSSLLYNYQFKFGATRVSFGTQLSYQHSTIDFSRYQYIQPNDPFLDPGNAHRNTLIADFGVACDMGNFSAGISTQNLAFLQDEATTAYRGRADADCNVFLNYKFTINPSLSITPSTRVKTDFNGSYNINVTGIAELKEMFLLGAGVEMGGGKITEIYSAGLIIAKRVQLIGIVYSGVNQTWSRVHNNVDLMLRVRIKNKQAS